MHSVNKQAHTAFRRTKKKVSISNLNIRKHLDSKENNSDIGTKRVPKFISEYLTRTLVDKS